MPSIVVVQHEPNGSADLMTPAFEQGSDLRVVRAFQGDPVPENVDGIDGLVVLGGEMGALDDDVAPWLPATRSLLARAVLDGVPTLGICLGAQLLAASTGGRVARGSAGLELGLVEVTPLAAAAADPFFGAVGRSVARSLPDRERWPVNQYHYDCVAELPPDAELLVTGDRYPVQGFRVGENAYGVQYHPEVSLAGFVGWVRGAQSKGELPMEPDVLIEVSAHQDSQIAVADAHGAALLGLAVTSMGRDNVSR